MKLLSWCDTSRFTINVNDEAQNFVADVLIDANGETPILETKIRATHSGHLITGRCYTGWGMRAGCPSWYKADSGGKSAFDKPVIKNHDLSLDPIGRVVFAEFTQLKDGNDWLNDWQNPDSGPGKLGSGYITTTAHVTDPDSIAKIMDGRLNTVSTRQVAHDVWCSIDGVNFREGCSHEIGEYYEGEDGEQYLCYATTGLLGYVELSYVGSPRQPNAVTQSFRMMRDSLAELGDNEGTLLVADSFLDFEQEMAVFMRQHDVLINLSDDTMPSTSSITGKTRVSMAGFKIDGAPKSTQLDGLEDAMKKAKDEKSEVETNDVQDETPDLGFTKLVAVWKDSLDLSETFSLGGEEVSYADSHYMMGITDKAARHAHAFEGFLDSKSKLLSGRTFGTGQGKTNHGHTHSIWQEEVDLNLTEVKGETRDAERGESHTHTFMASMVDSENSCGTLIASVESINGAIAYIDSEANKDTSELNDALLKDDSQIVWDAETVKAALPLLGRLNPTKRQEIILSLLDSGFFGEDQPDTEDSNMKTSETVERLLQKLMDENDSLKTKLAAATQLADSKEEERQKLLGENKDLKEGSLRLKARLIVDAQDRLSEEELDEEAKDAKVAELAAKDEAELDKLLDSEVLDKLVKTEEPSEDPEDLEDSKDEKKTTADLVADKTDPIVPERGRNETKDSAGDKGSSKSLDAMTARANKVFVR